MWPKEGRKRKTSEWMQYEAPSEKKENSKKGGKFTQTIEKD